MPSFGISFGKSSSSGTGALSYDYEKGEYFEGCISEEAREYLRFMNKLYAAVSYTHLLRLAFTNRTYCTMTPPQAASTKPHSLRFCMVQCFQAHAQKRIGARSARSRASGGLEVIIP